LRYTVPDCPHTIDSKAERCRSGRSSTLGKRFWPASPSDTDTPRGAFDSTAYGVKVFLDVNP